MKIILYRKTGCPWAQEVIDYLNQRGMPFDDRDINKHQEYAREIEQKSGQSKSPALDIDGHILADAGLEEVEEYLETVGAKS